MKFTLREIRINNQGYDSAGQYWGVGQRLYEYERTDVDAGEHAQWGHVRAYYRDQAKARVRLMFPTARFYN